MYEWRSFLWTADEFFIAYSLPPLNLLSVKLFLIGHTVEMYLKAANTKITGDIDRAIRFGHKIKEIWADCKGRDPNFMPSYEIRDSVCNEDLFTQDFWSKSISQKPSERATGGFPASACADKLPVAPDSGIISNLSKDDFRHFMQNQGLYMIAKLLPDLKYLGTPMKFLKGAYGLGQVVPDPYWIDFLRELRTYLQHPNRDGLDVIKHHIEENDMPRVSIAYLGQLYA